MTETATDSYSKKPAPHIGTGFSCLFCPVSRFSIVGVYFIVKQIKTVSGAFCEAL